MLIDSLKGNALNEDYLEIFYSFNEYSGVWNFNEKYENAKSLTVGYNSDCPSLDYYPAYQVSCARASFNENCIDNGCSLFSGAGHFDGSTVLRIGKDIPFEDWTVFINFESSDSVNTPALGKSLLTSMENTSSPSGFGIGINGANKLYYEHFNKNGVIDTVTLNTELGGRNLISVSKNASSENIELIYHDKVHGKDISAGFSLNNVVDSNDVNRSFSKNWYLGDHFEPSPGYTGFSGCMFDFVLFSAALSSTIKNDIANAFFSKDYSGNRIGFEESTYKVISQDPEITTVLTGTGITGYESVLESLPVRCPDTTVNTCVLSGVTGELSGQVIDWGFGEEEVTVKRPVRLPAKYYYCDEYVESYGKNNIVFINNLEPIDSFDAYEIYKYDDIKTNLNKEGTLIQFTHHSTEIDCSMDIKVNNKLITPMSGDTVNFYANGLAQVPKTFFAHQSYRRHDYTVVNEPTKGRKVVMDSNSFVNDFGKASSDIYSHTYDDIQGYTFVSGYSGSSDPLTFGEAAAAAYAGVPDQDLVIGKDIYLNGKKLISGINYSLSSENPPTVEIDRSTLNGLETGEMLFTPQGDYNLRVTGKNQTVVNFDSNIISEQVWLNGKREKPSLGYYKTINNSLLTYNNTAVPHRVFQLFDGKETFFN